MAMSEITKICPICGSAFKTKSKTAKYCSPQCNRKAYYETEAHQKKPPTSDAKPIRSFTCRVCGRRVDVYEKKDQRHVYCSGVCFANWKNNLKPQKNNRKGKRRGELGISSGMSLSSLKAREARSVDKKEIIKFCENCGRQIIDPRPTQKYCCLECQGQAYYLRNTFRRIPRPGEKVIREFYCRQCGGLVQVVDKDDRRTVFCCAEHERKYWRDVTKHSSAKHQLKTNLGMSSGMSLGSLKKREARDLRD